MLYAAATLFEFQMKRTRRWFFKAVAVALTADLPRRARAQAHSEIRVGSIAFRLGLPDAVTRAIVAHSPLPPAQRKYSHAGIVAATGRHVIHALPRVGVHVSTIDEFVAESRDVAFLLPPPSARALAIANAAASMLGAPFDDDLRLSESDALYCTELVACALKKTGVLVDPRLLRVPFFDEPVIHPDTLFLDLLAAGFQSAMRNSSIERPD